MVNGNPLPFGITYTSAGNSFTIKVDTALTVSKGAHELMIEAKLGPYTKTDTRFTVNIYEFVVTSFNIPDITYNVKAARRDEPVKEIVYSIDPPTLAPAGVTWTYEVKYKDNYATALPGFLTFNQVSPTAGTLGKLEI